MSNDNYNKLSILYGNISDLENLIGEIDDLTENYKKELSKKLTILNKTIILDNSIDEIINNVKKEI